MIDASHPDDSPSDRGAQGLVGELLERCSFPAPGSSVVCGVSGGADSSALLVLAVAAGLSVTAVHVDHGVRPGSQRDAELVAALAMRFGVAFEVRALEIEPGPNLEARMRAARHEALGPDALLGHTADDQAETVLLHLMRGAGLDGVAAMRADRHPLLGMRRAETVALCESLAIRYLVDPTNADASFRRNRVRHELLPLMDDIACRDVAALLARTAAFARDDVDLLDRLAASLDPTDCVVLLESPLPLARRALRRWLAPHTGGYAPDAAAIERVMAVVRGEAVACELEGGLRVARSRQRLSVSR